MKEWDPRSGVLPDYEDLPDDTDVHLDRYASDHGGLVGHMIGEHPALHAAWEAGDTLGELNDQHHIAHGRLTSEAELVEDIHRDNTGGDWGARYAEWML